MLKCMRTIVNGGLVAIGATRFLLNAKNFS